MWKVRSMTLRLKILLSSLSPDFSFDMFGPQGLFSISVYEFGRDTVSRFSEMFFGISLLVHQDLNFLTILNSVYSKIMNFQVEKKERAQNKQRISSFFKDLNCIFYFYFTLNKCLSIWSLNPSLELEGPHLFVINAASSDTMADEAAGNMLNWRDASAFFWDLHTVLPNILSAEVSYTHHYHWVLISLH